MKCRVYRMSRLHLFMSSIPCHCNDFMKISSDDYYCFICIFDLLYILPFWISTNTSNSLRYSLSPDFSMSQYRAILAYFRPKIRTTESIMNITICHQANYAWWSIYDSHFSNSAFTSHNSQMQPRRMLDDGDASPTGGQFTECRPLSSLCYSDESKSPSAAYYWYERKTNEGKFIDGLLQYRTECHGLHFSKELLDALASYNISWYISLDESDTSEAKPWKFKITLKYDAGRYCHECYRHELINLSRHMTPFPQSPGLPKNESHNDGHFFRASLSAEAAH
jgi:hypothetical protein